MNNETPEDRTARSTPEDTFRRLKRAPIDTALRLVCGKLNISSFHTARQLVENGRKRNEVLSLDTFYKPLLEGTGWTIDELNQELQRMYDDNS